jgi:hypothetical protein
VDAYPGEMFEGRVSFIAHKAEFTPRNVQTQEERVNLVFAVKISLNNADHRLKPGMPADAEILINSKPGLVEIPATPALPQATSTPPASALTVTPEARPPTRPASAVAPTAPPATSGAKDQSTATPTKVVTSTRQAEVIAWELRVRSGPGIDYPIITHLSRGDVIPIIGVDPQTGWFQVRLPGEKTGWISSKPDYVSAR